MPTPTHSPNPEATSFTPGIHSFNTSSITSPDVASLSPGVTSFKQSTPLRVRNVEIALPMQSVSPSSKTTSARRSPNPEAQPFVSQIESLGHKEASTSNVENNSPTSQADVKPASVVPSSRAQTYLPEPGTTGDPTTATAHTKTSALSWGPALTAYGRTLLPPSHLSIQTSRAQTNSAAQTASAAGNGTHLELGGTELGRELIIGTWLNRASKSAPSTSVAIESTTTGLAYHPLPLAAQALALVQASHNSNATHRPALSWTQNSWVATNTTADSYFAAVPMRVAHHPNFVFNPSSPLSSNSIRNWEGTNIIARLEGLKVQLSQIEHDVQMIQDSKHNTAGHSNIPTYSNAVKAEDRLLDLERTLLHVVTAITGINTHFESALSSMKVTNAAHEIVEGLERRTAEGDNQVASNTSKDTMESAYKRTTAIASQVASTILKDTIETVQKRSTEIASQVASILVKDTIKDIVEMVIETVLDRVDVMHDSEVARLQERSDRYSRSNRILRSRLRFKSARAKENTRGNSSVSDLDSMHTPALFREPAVDLSGSVRINSKGIQQRLESSAAIVEDDAKAFPVKGEASGSNNDYSAFDLGFLDSLSGIEDPDKTYLRHFMAPAQFDGAEAEVAQDISPDSDSDVADLFSKSVLIRSSPPKVIKTGLDVSRGTFSAPPTPAKAGPSIVMEATRAIPRVESWNGSIRWAVPGVLSASELRECKNREEQLLEREYRHHHSDGTSRMREEYIYGIRYEPPINVSNLRRTAVVTNLPIKIQARTLLRQVRGGMVYSVSIMNTTSILGSASALVTFVQERSAAMFVNRAAVKSLVFDEKRASAKLVSTPTWPMPKVVEHGILEQGYTRVLVVFDCNSPVVEEGLLKELKSLTIVDTVATAASKNGGFVISFTSVVAAKKAYDFIASSPLYYEYNVQFGEDPCAEN